VQIDRAIRNPVTVKLSGKTTRSLPYVLVPSGDLAYTDTVVSVTMQQF